MTGPTAANATPEVPIDPRLPIPMNPVRWLDTTPQESDDKPASIASLDATVKVSGLYADITETIVIQNPNTRPLSVPIAIAMPDRAVVCGYALDIDGELRDGVVVPKEKARVAFETEQRRGADPGLVESVKGNVYRTRVYPVPANGKRTVRLRYVAPLVVSGDGAFLDVPMPEEHLSTRRLDISVALLDCPAPVLSGANMPELEVRGTCWEASLDEHDVDASSALRIALPKLPASFCLVEKDTTGDIWFSASERAPKPAAQAPAIERITVIWDASGSRAGLDLSREMELAAAYCANAKSIRLISFSDKPEDPEIFESGEALAARLATIPRDGGSDFSALSDAFASLDAAENEVFVLFTDGLDTLAGKPIAFPADLKIVSIVSGVERDAESLRQACAGLVFDAAIAPEDAASLAKAAFCAGLLSAVEGDGIAEVLGIGSGRDGRFSVIGKMCSDKATATFADTRTAFALDASEARTSDALSLAWAAMRVAQLSPRSDDNASELFSLGRRFGVVSPATSLLVLETIDQWLRYDIEPPASWTHMHDEWEKMRPGLMQHGSDAGRAVDHLAALKRSWKELLEWHARDYPIAPEPADIVRDMAAMPRSAASALGGAMDNMRLSIFNAVESAGSSANMRGASMMAFAEPAGAVVDGFAVMEECAEVLDGECDYEIEASRKTAATDETAGPSVSVKAWMPDAEYITALSEAKTPEAAREVYFAQRPDYAASPSFFIDCAGFFFAAGDNAFAVRVLTNLAELRIEDAALLRVMAWRLREADELELALVVLRRVLGLRGEDSQSHRDLALVLDELARASYAAGNEEAAKSYAEEAASFYKEVATTPWQRRANAVALFAVEEYNVLRAWADTVEWKEAPVLESIDEDLEGVLDCDLRITLAWDADETDVDIHVTEPGGEEAYYGNRWTRSGGRCSEDITDGYGPEVYEIRHAQDGTYHIRAHYYASHQQVVFGPATCTLTIYTDWGRAGQSSQVTSMRLEKAKEMVDIGTAAYGEAAIAGQEDAAVSPAPPISKGDPASALVEAFGQPDEGDASSGSATLAWNLPGGRRRVAVVEDGCVVKIVESMSWGEEMVVFQ